MFINLIYKDKRKWNKFNFKIIKMIRCLVTREECQLLGFNTIVAFGGILI